MRPDHRPEGQGQIGAVAQAGRDPVRPADDEGHVLPPFVAGPGDEAGEIGGRHLPAAFVEHDEEGARGRRATEKVGLRLHPAALAVLDLVNGNRAEAERPARPVEPFQVVVDQREFGACAQAPDRADVQTHQFCRALSPAPAGIHIFSSW